MLSHSFSLFALTRTQTQDRELSLIQSYVQMLFIFPNVVIQIHSHDIIASKCIGYN